MKYFELISDPDISNPIHIKRIDTNIYHNGISQEEFDAIKRLQVVYFDNTPQVEFCDVLQDPAFLVSDALKRVFVLYEPEMKFKGLQLYASDLEDNTAPLYWMPYITPITCLSSQSKIYPNGMLESMILDYDMPTCHHIFRVAGILEYKIIVSLSVAESIIRRKLSGVSFVPVVWK